MARSSSIREWIRFPWSLPPVCPRAAMVSHFGHSENPYSGKHTSMVKEPHKFGLAGKPVLAWTFLDKGEGTGTCSTRIQVPPQLQ